MSLEQSCLNHMSEADVERKQPTDTLLLDDSTHYTERPWRRWQTKVTQAIEREKKNISTTVFLGCIFLSSSTLSPRKIYWQRRRRKKKLEVTLFTVGKPLDGSQQWWEFGTCLIRAGRFLRLQGVWVCVSVRWRAHEFQLCGEIRAMRWLSCLRQRDSKKIIINK